jgi:hypothetical protein
MLAKMLFSKKYGGCCYKIQACVPSQMMSHVISQAGINAPTPLLDWYQFPASDGLFCTQAFNLVLPLMK